MSELYTKLGFNLLRKINLFLIDGREGHRKH